MSRVVFLAGMPGTGKTAVGALLARRLGLAFLDLDRRVEEITGMSPATLFERGGEAGFRDAERSALSGLAGIEGSVVATGGWTVGDAANRARMAAAGTTICLTAPPEILASRLEGAGVAARPLLAPGADPAETLRDLLRRRRSVYDSVPWQVDTTDRDAAAAADAVARLLPVAESLGSGVRAVPVATPSGGYGVLVGPGLLDAVGRIAAARGLAARSAVVADETVGRLYAGRTLDSLRDGDVSAVTLSMGVGEPAKSLSTVAALYDGLVAAGVDRHGAVFTLGGGVVGDTAGFAAATYLRGIRVVHVPTSLLAMVDASIGGKTAVNLTSGKNLAGAFHQPSVVIADPSVLATLPTRELSSGLAEIVKTAMVGDARLFEHLESRGVPAAGDVVAWSGLIVRAASVKAAIVSEDPLEIGRRTVLNLGHTFAHALETASGHRVSHGEAVAVGLVAACRLARRIGLADADLAQRVETLLVRLGLPTRLVVEPSAVVSAMAPDKKRRQGRVRFVLPVELGRVELIEDVPTGDVLAVLEGLREAS